MRKLFREAITLRTNILTNFVAVIALITGVLLLLQYHFNRQIVLDATSRTFRHIAQRVAIHLESNDRLIRNILYQMELYPEVVEEPPIDTVPGNAYRFIRTMSHLAYIYSMYVGYPNGDIFEVINYKPTFERTVFEAPAKTRWILVRVFRRDGKRIWRTDYYDFKMRLLSRKEEATSYDARKRPWYVLANRHTDVVRSIPYLFQSTKKKGITYSKKVGKSRGVVAIDFTLEGVEAFLREQVFAPTARVQIFKEGEILIASSDGTDETDILFSTIYRKRMFQKVFSLREKGRRTYAMVMNIPNGLGSSTYLGMSVETAVMMKPYVQNTLCAFGAAFVVLLLSIPLTVFTTSRIVRPIKALMRENIKVKERRFDDVQPVRTRIVELVEVSESLISMSRSIQNYEKSLENMIESFVKLIAGAIDAKSAYTGGHCKRVPVLALELAKAAHASNEGAFRSFHFEKEEDWKAFEMGAWLHDCGKITTPEFVVDKATRLETIYNRIHEIRTRFEVLWRDVDVAFYQRLIAGEDKETLERWREDEHKRLLEDFAFVARCNMGSEFMDEAKKRRLRAIAKRTWIRHFSNRLGISDREEQLFGGVAEPSLPVVEPLLSDRPEHLVPRLDFDVETYRQKGFKLEVPKYLYNFGELYNLSIERGTLTPEDVFKIREHIIMTIEMLEQLPYPDPLAKIPEYAGTHHETLRGTGYPRKLKGEHLSIPSRIMAIADVFEALTASDRPYKKGETLSKTLSIMASMVEEGHLDAALFVLFVRSGIYKKYAEEYLKTEQLDDVDEEGLLKRLW